MNSLRDFFKVLFDPTEFTCAGSKFDTGILPVTDIGTDSEYICINPLNGSRCDDNVTVYRNLLIESDTIPVPVQIQRMNGLRLPYSAATFSGGKSIHFIISLEEPLANRTEYNATMKRLYRGLNSLDFPVDKNCKNPSRFSRTPGHLRNGVNEQTLMFLGERVKRAAIEGWLADYAPPTQPPSERPNLGNWRRVLNGFTQNFLMMGTADGKGNHDACILAAFDFKRCSYSFEEALARISVAPGIDQCDRIQREVYEAIVWVYEQGD